MDGFADRRRRRVIDSDDDEDFFATNNDNESKAEEKVEDAPKGPCPGSTVGGLIEEVRKKLQQQLIEGMFKYAEQKYGRKRPQNDAEKGTAREDYELYLKSLKVKVKQANDRLQAVLRQKKEIEKKVEEAQKEADLLTGKLTEAEEEKDKAVEENRDPILPKSFVVPQRSKRIGATLGALVMKASKTDWGAALQQFAANRRSNTAGKAPEWTAKRDKTAAILKAGVNKKTNNKKAENIEEEAAAT